MWVSFSSRRCLLAADDCDAAVPPDDLCPLADGGRSHGGARQRPVVELGAAILDSFQASCIFLYHHVSFTIISAFTTSDLFIWSQLIPRRLCCSRLRLLPILFLQAPHSCATKKELLQTCPLPPPLRLLRVPRRRRRRVHLPVLLPRRPALPPCRQRSVQLLQGRHHPRRRFRGQGRRLEVVPRNRFQCCPFRV